MSKDYYRQCRLNRIFLDEETGKEKIQFHQAWLPEKVDGAPLRPGRVLSINLYGGEDGWVNEWVVVSVSSERRELKEADARSRDHTKQRAFSDV